MGDIMQMDLELIQTIGIIATLIFTTITLVFTISITIVQLKRTRTSNQITIYNNITAMLNNLRNLRIKDPDLEKALFAGRSILSDLEIKTRDYAVELANIFELMWLSRKTGLVGKSVWDEWIYLWKTIILSDESMATLLTDPTIYTFSRLEAGDAVIKISENKDYIVPDPYIGLFKELFYQK